MVQDVVHNKISFLALHSCSQDWTYILSAVYPEKIKKLTSLNRFKDHIKTWNGPNCKCYLCR